MKKILSLLLAVVLLLGILPANIFADNFGSDSVIENRATLTVKAVPNFTALRVNQRFAVTTTATGGTIPYRYANYVIKDGKIIFKGGYTTNRVFYYVPKIAGTYKVTSFVKDATGLIKTATTVPIKVTNYPTAPLNIYVSMNKTSMYVNNTVTVRASATGGTGNYMYAFYVYKNGQLIKTYPYSTKQILYYKATSAGAYKFTAFVRDSNNNRVAKSTTIHTVVEIPKPKYRALVIGQHEYWDHYLSGTDVDARNMYNKFLNNPPYGKMEKLQGWLDVSGRGILSEISKTFAGADNNSVSIFYYSGHGSSDGYIFGTDNPYAGSGAVSSTELANALKQIPGKIVVILDCCHSGYHINKSMSEEDIAAFNANIINAFKAVDVVSKTPGQMANSKFHVLTASSKTEVSWGSSTGGVFTKALVNAKDRNSDGFVSIGEGYWAAKAYDNVPIYSEGQYYYQHVQCYPSANDPLLLWKK